MVWHRVRNPDPTAQDATPTEVDAARKGPIRGGSRVRRCRLTTA
jgi:hypothetical protein